jgi:hypothetical protein
MGSPYNSPLNTWCKNEFFNSMFLKIFSNITSFYVTGHLRELYNMLFAAQTGWAQPTSNILDGNTIGK